MADFDVIVIGSGPGGYVAAIRAAQLHHKVAIIEKEHLGGICLNWGCIPTKALLKSAQVLNYLKHATNYGIEQTNYQPNFNTIINRSREIANGMQKGIQYLMKKNKIEVIEGYGKLLPGKCVEVTSEDNQITHYTATHIILATGARPKVVPSLPIDNNYIIDYKKAMSLQHQPKEIIIVGAGAIGVEFAHFYNSIDTKVTLIEFADTLLPNEDKEIGKTLEKLFIKNGIQVHTSSKVLYSRIEDNLVKLVVSTADKELELTSPLVLSAIGISPNIENIGLELCGIQTEHGRIKTNAYGQTSVDGVYAIGDITLSPALAHVASAEAVIAAEHLSNHITYPLNWSIIPSCTYCSPEVASVGITEQQALAKGYTILVGKFPFSASGKAKAIGNTNGFVKVVIDKQYDEILGVHAIGENVTEIIQEAVLAKHLEATATSVLHAIHPHPTISEALKEAIENAYGNAIHL